MNEQLAIDHFFAEAMHPSNDEEKLSYATLFASARMGNLCTVASDLPCPLVRGVTNEEGFVYLNRNYQIETEIVRELRRLSLREEVKEEIPELPKGLLPEQINAVELALRSPLSILSGGPGTGKSFTAKVIVETYLSMFPEKKVMIAAPTGKAAFHLGAKLPSIETSTLHSLLHIRSSRDYGKETLPLACDFLIVDEASMIEVRLLLALLKAAKHTKLLFLGDAKQLPPVEAGSIFRDLLSILPTAELKTCMRAESAHVIEVADAIERGEIPLLSPLSLSTLFDPFPSPTQDKPDPKKALEEMNRYRILSSVKKGPLGIEELNRLAFEKKTRRDHFAMLPILIEKNDERTKLFNGEIGVLITKKRELRWDREDHAYFLNGKGELRKIPALLLPRFSLAFAITVHKSQGSEFDEVVALFPEGSEKFSREILYTAVTRAKKRIAISGSLDAIEHAIHLELQNCSRIKQRFCGSTLT